MSAADWWGVALVSGVLLAQGAGFFLVMNHFAQRAHRRERIDIEAHEAYMNGGYPAYWAVYEKYGVVRRRG